MEPKTAPMLHGKVIVVVGGTSGIGFSACKAFIAAGARLSVVGLDQESANGAAAAFGANAIVSQGDACHPETATKAIQRALDFGAGCHGLYHVAGGSGRRWGDGPLHELTDEGWQATLQLNLTSVMLSNRAAVRHFLQQGTGGAVVNLTSVLANSPVPKLFATHAYAAAKAGIIGLTRSSAALYANQNIRFNALAPGLVATPMSRRAQESAEIQQYARLKQPLGKGGMLTPEALDAAAVWLLSDAATYVTGQVITVDGGWSVSEPSGGTQ